MIAFVLQEKISLVVENVLEETGVEVRRLDEQLRDSLEIIHPHSSFLLDYENRIHRSQLLKTKSLWGFQGNSTGCLHL